MSSKAMSLKGRIKNIAKHIVAAREKKEIETTGELIEIIKYLNVKIEEVFDERSEITVRERSLILRYF